MLDQNDFTADSSVDASVCASGWSEHELDSALVELRLFFDGPELALARLRGEVLVSVEPTLRVQSARDGQNRRGRSGVAAVLVAAAVLLAGVVSLGGEAPTASAGPTEVLLSAAALTTPDPSPLPGQFTRIATHAWYLNGMSMGDVLVVIS